MGRVSGVLVDRQVNNIIYHDDQCVCSFSAGVKNSGV
jgi:hypothetical protein